MSLPLSVEWIETPLRNSTSVHNMSLPLSVEWIETLHNTIITIKKAVSTLVGRVD